MKHDEFLERMTKAVKLAGQAIIDNADQLVAKVDENLGVQTLDISIALGTMTDDSLDVPEIEVKTTYIPIDVTKMLAGFEEGEF